MSPLPFGSGSGWILQVQPVPRGKIAWRPSTEADELVEHTTVAAVEEKAKLQKHFGRFDIFFFLICTLVGLDTLGAVSNDGAQAFTWLAFLGIFFFIPYALLASELGSSFTEEGGAYVWVKLAFGRFTAAINSVLYWLSNPIWLGGTLTILAVTTFSEFFTPLHGVWKYLFSPRLHLVRGVGGDPLLRGRQVDPHDRRLGPDRLCSAASP